MKYNSSEPNYSVHYLSTCKKTFSVYIDSFFNSKLFLQP
jgi:hypothetical protein